MDCIFFYAIGVPFLVEGPCARFNVYSYLPRDLYGCNNNDNNNNDNNVYWKGICYKHTFTKHTFIKLHPLSEKKNID